MIKVLATGSKGNCYLLTAGNKTLVIECGISYKEILKGLNFSIYDVVGCLVTHEHKDHCKAVNDILRAGIDVYMSKGTREGINFKNSDYDYRIHEIEYSNMIKIGDFKILPFKTQHDVNEPLGFLIYHQDIGKVLFATDTYYLKYIFPNVDHILIECNYSERDLDDLPDYKIRVLKSHMSLETLKESLPQWDLKGTKDITLIHLSESNSDPEYFRETIEKETGIKTLVAVPGLEVI